MRIFLVGCLSSIFIVFNAFADITVTQVTQNSALELDRSILIEVTFSSDTTERVIPMLNLPASCSSLEPLINITPAAPGELPLLASAGTPVDVAFWVHSLEDPTSPGDGICHNTCLDSPFELTFERLDGSTVPISSQPALVIQPPASDADVLKSVIAGFTGPSFFHTGFGIDITLNQVTDTTALMSNFDTATDRLILYIDWNNSSGTHPENFLEIAFPVRDPSNPCFFNWIDAIANGLDLYPGSPINYFGDEDLTGFPRGSTISQAPIGGAGTQVDPTGQGVNLFDVTQAATQCGNFYQNLDYAASSNLFVPFYHSGGWWILRRMFLLHMELDGCAALDPSFQISNNQQFSISDLEITRHIEQGAQRFSLTSTLRVPSKWLLNSQTLKSSYRIDWYLKKNDDAGTELLVASTDSPYLEVASLPVELSSTNTPSYLNDYHLLAVVSYQNSSFISTELPFELPYDNQIELVNSLFSSTFQFEIDGPDEDAILDPGEQVDIVFNFKPGTSFTNLSYGYLDGSSIIYNDGSVLLANGSTATVGEGFWPSALMEMDSSINIVSNQVELPFLLLEAPSTANRTFFLQTRQRIPDVFGNLATVNLNYQFQLNEKDIELGIDLNGQTISSDSLAGIPPSSFSSEARSTQTITPNPSTPSGDQLWHQSTDWTCSAPASALENELHTLTTPPLAFSDRATLKFMHQTFFQTDSEGGYIEYQTYKGASVIQSWQNVASVSPGAVNLYDMYQLQGGGSELDLQDQNNWVRAMDQEELVQIPISLTGLDEATSIAFRFVYQAPLDVNTGSSDKWTLRDLQLINHDYQRDNLFSVDLTQVHNPCSEVGGVVFLPSSPYAPEDFSYIWYADKDELYQGVGIQGTQKVPMLFKNRNVTQGYVEMLYELGGQAARRIYQLSMQGQSLFTFCELVDVPSSPGGDIALWPASLTILDIVRDYLECPNEAGEDCQAEYLAGNLSVVEGPDSLGYPRTSYSYDATDNLFQQAPLGTTQERSPNGLFIAFDDLLDWNRDQNGETLSSQWVQNTQLSYRQDQNDFLFEPNDPGLGTGALMAGPPYVMTYLEFKQVATDPEPLVDGRFEEFMGLFETRKTEYANWIVSQVNLAQSKYVLGYDELTQSYFFVSPSGISDTLFRADTSGSGDPPMWLSTQVKTWADGITP